MKKIIAMVIIAVLVVTIGGCAEQTIDPAARNVPVDEYGRSDTPVRIGQVGRIMPQYDEYTLDLAFEYSDIIADITIVEWIGEAKNGNATFFRAKVNKTLKGEEYKEIELIQTGDSEFTIVEFPLLKNGDRLLAILKEPSSYSDDDYQGKYWIDHIALLDVLEYEGKPYLLNRGEWPFGADFRENDDVKKIKGELRDSINEEFRKHDPVLTEIWEETMRHRISDSNLESFIEEENKRNETESASADNLGHQDVFDYDDVVKIITRRLKEGGE